MMSPEELAAMSGPFWQALEDWLESTGAPPELQTLGVYLSLRSSEAILRQEPARFSAYQQAVDMCRDVLSEAIKSSGIPEGGD